MKYLTKWAPFLQALIPFLHIVLTLCLVYGMAKQTDQIAFQADVLLALDEKVSCAYFLNVEEYVGGTSVVYSTGISSRSIPQIELEWKKQIQSEQAGCNSGLCPDSARVTMYRDCTGNYDIEICRDTLIVL